MEKKQKVERRLSSRYFGKEAAEYDKSRLDDVREKDVFERELEIVRKFLENSKKGKILDVACGTGRVFPQYGSREIHGTDLSKDMLKRAKKINPKAKLKVANAEKLPYKDNTFPVVITSRFIMHTPKYEKIISEMTRVLQPKGSLIIDFPNRRSLSYFTTKIRLRLGIGKLKYFNLFTYSQIKKIARKNNLEIKGLEAKIFIPPKIFPKFMHKIAKSLNKFFTKLFPLLSTPLYFRFVKKK